MTVRSILFLLLFLCAASTEAATPRDCEGPVLAVLVDVSEPLSLPAQLAFSSLTQRLIAISPEGGALAVYSIDVASSDTGQERARLCIPNFSEYKGEKFKQRKLEKFQSQLVAIMQEVASLPASAKNPPILESVFKMVHKQFFGGRAIRTGRVVVVSDFIQNSEAGNFYRTVPAYDSWAKSVAGRQWAVQAKAIGFTAVALPRQNFSNDAALTKIRSFWLDYMKTNFTFCGWSGLNNAATEVADVCR